MPLYEYQCDHCEELFEIIQKFSDDPLSECELCGGKLERLLSPPSIQFKGDGWYVTDYGGKNGKNSSSATNSPNSSEKNTQEAPKSKPAPNKED
jgi:putative FmdB family regulatory protein